MSSVNEQDPRDPAYYAPRRLRERAGSELVRAPISRSPSLDPDLIDEPPGAEQRSALLTVAGRFAAVAGVVMVAALFFVFVLPATRQSGAALPAPEITGSTTTGSTKAAPSQVSQQDSASKKPALAEFQALLASPPASAPPATTPAAHEQSQQLLQEFMQWRQKADSSQ
jgi:hypothetical protein